MERRPADQVIDRSFDPFLADMQCSDLVPIRRMGGKVTGGLFGPETPDFGKPAAVGGAGRVARREHGEDGRKQPACRSAACRKEKDPGALAVTLDQSGFDQELEMP